MDKGKNNQQHLGPAVRFVLSCIDIQLEWHYCKPNLHQTKTFFTSQ